MSSTFYDRSTSSATETWTVGGAGGVASPSYYTITAASAAAASVSKSITAGNVINDWHFTVAATDEFSGDWNGTYTVLINVTAIGANTIFGVSPQCINTLGTTRLLTGLDLGTQSGTGVKTATGTGFSGAAVPTSGRLGVNLRCVNSASMTAQTLTVQFNDSNAAVTVPWTVGATAAAPPPLAAFDRRLRRNTLLRR